MKKILLMFFCVSVALMAMAQIKKPTIMVIPSNAWCNQNGYVDEIDNQGTTMIVPNYTMAFQNDMELKLVIAKINDLMAERGFPLVDLEATLNRINQQTAEDNMITSKNSGASIMETPYEKLRRTAKADIIMELTWDVQIQGPKKTLSFILEGKDSYTSKSIGGANGVSQPSFSATTPVLLEEAVLAHIDNFNDRLQAHFDELIEIGREVSIEVRVFENELGVDLESMFEGEELTEIIDNWMADNTVEGRYSFVEGSENLALFEQVRIPLYDIKGRAMDANRFARELRKLLQSEPYSIPVKLLNKGLGKAVLIVGDK
jgi:hypothetical protein